MISRARPCCLPAALVAHTPRMLRLEVLPIPTALLEGLFLPLPSPSTKRAESYRPAEPFCTPSSGVLHLLQSPTTLDGSDPSPGPAGCIRGVSPSCAITQPLSTAPAPFPKLHFKTEKLSFCISHPPDSPAVQDLVLCAKKCHPTSRSCCREDPSSQGQ